MSKNEYGYAQDLLDSGLTPNKTAEILGVHHSKVSRLIKRGILEIYVPFDQRVIYKPHDQNDWLMEEDWLEELCSKAFYNGVAYLRRSGNEENIRVGRYVRENYGSLKGYLSKKKMTPLQESIEILCPGCSKYYLLKTWYVHEARLWGLNNECPRCRSMISAKYAKNNPDKLFVLRQKRRSMAEALPNQFSKSDWIKIRSNYSWRCCITGLTNGISNDHFIPVITGQGGTYLGNIIPMVREMNCSKKDKNPFGWAAAKQLDLQKVILQLSYENSLTINEYCSFVNWCFDNPRTVDEVRADQRHSIEIYREATGQHFPLPKYALSELGNRSTNESDGGNCQEKQEDAAI